MPKLTAQQDSLVNRIALAIVRLEEARAAMAALSSEPALTKKQHAAAERMTGNLSGMGEALDYWRPRSTGGAS